MRRVHYLSSALSWPGRWTLAVSAWGIGLAAIIALLAWLNAETNPTVEAGVAAGAGLIAYFLLGVNAWFLRALIADLQMTRLLRERNASPLLQIVRFAGADVVLENVGVGAARGVEVLRVELSRYIHGQNQVLADFMVGWLPTMGAPNVSRQVAMVHRSQWSFSVDRSPPKVRLQTRYFRIGCYDELSRLHMRWFHTPEQPEGFVIVQELPGGHAPHGAASAPGGNDSAVKGLESLNLPPFSGWPHDSLS